MSTIRTMDDKIKKVIQAVVCADHTDPNANAKLLALYSPDLFIAAIQNLYADLHDISSTPSSRYSSSVFSLVSAVGETDTSAVSMEVEVEIEDSNDDAFSELTSDLTSEWGDMLTKEDRVAWTRACYRNELHQLKRSFVNAFMVRLPNHKNGNCLFESFAQQDLSERTHKMLRGMVADYYDMYKHELESGFISGGGEEENDAITDSLDAKIRTAYLVDNIDYHKITGKPLKRLHSVRVREDKQYAGIMDIMVLCKLLSRNVILVQANPGDLDMVLVHVYLPDAYPDVVEPPVMLYYEAEHFEALCWKIK